MNMELDGDLCEDRNYLWNDNLEQSGTVTSNPTDAVMPQLEPQTQITQSQVSQINENKATPIQIESKSQSNATTSDNGNTNEDENKLQSDKIVELVSHIQQLESQLQKQRIEYQRKGERELMKYRSLALRLTVENNQLRQTIKQLEGKQKNSNDNCNKRDETNDNSKNKTKRRANGDNSGDETSAPLGRPVNGDDITTGVGRAVAVREDTPDPSYIIKFKMPSKIRRRPPNPARDPRFKASPVPTPSIDTFNSLCTRKECPKCGHQFKTKEELDAHVGAGCNMFKKCGKWGYRCRTNTNCSFVGTKEDAKKHQYEAQHGYFWDRRLKRAHLLAKLPNPNQWTDALPTEHS